MGIDEKCKGSKDTKMKCESPYASLNWGILHLELRIDWEIESSKTLIRTNKS